MHRNIYKIVIISSVTILSLAGCNWRDDFRYRIQPQSLGEDARPTFNEFSPYYVGDDVAYPIPAADEVDMSNVDELSEIPELPEKANVLRY